MARQAMWNHGNVVALRYPGGKGDPVWGNHTEGHGMNGVIDPSAGGRIEWSDVVGLRTDTGVRFDGRADQTNVFDAPIPTPCWRDDDGRATLAMVGFLYTSDDFVTIQTARVFDGPNHLTDLAVESSGGPHTELVENVTRFDLKAPPPVLWGIQVVFEVLFAQDGTIEFHAVGADFNV
jgi:hypothetical protein